MAKYPIRISVARYQGTNPGKKAQNMHEMTIGNIIETWLNKEFEERNSSRVTFSYFEIASALFLNESLVHKLVFPVDFGNNGVTMER